MLIPGKTACKEGNGILSDVDDDGLRFEDARQAPLSKCLDLGKNFQECES